MLLIVITREIPLKFTVYELVPSHTDNNSQQVQGRAVFLQLTINNILFICTKCV